MAALRDGALVAYGTAPETVTPTLLRRLYGIDVLVADLPGAAAPVCAPVLTP